MRTAIAMLIGIVAVFCFLAVASSVNKNRRKQAIDGARWFIWTWLAVTVIDFIVGVGAGHGVALELGVHLLIFAVPAALAWYLRGRRRAALGPPTDVRPSSDE